MVIAEAYEYDCEKLKGSMYLLIFCGEIGPIGRSAI
jgi:hypothetical protein